MNIQGENNLSATSGTKPCGRRNASAGRFPVPAPEVKETASWKAGAQRPPGSLGCGAAPRSPGRCCSEGLPGASRDGPPEGTALSRSLGAGASALPAPSPQPPTPALKQRRLVQSQNKGCAKLLTLVFSGAAGLSVGRRRSARAERTAGAALPEAGGTAKAARPPRLSTPHPRPPAPALCLCPGWGLLAPRTDSSWCADALTASDSSF
ncbi:unnamed protein product [Rangifer tarandus platyrhynchus]|uniref:Uncharacterized protein n=2 Tax=Rangifer tarandus platyrhynchus TaxID=3082113 RepID=A0ABN8YW62_RANTA|nr:unnamed protein product [Rangifer tarandus platyrhynchus]CAI9702453.1 unnamed protein product [Rangifer tarandus platyrhynchus]